MGSPLACRLWPVDGYVIRGNVGDMVKVQWCEWCSAEGGDRPWQHGAWLLIIRPCSWTLGACQKKPLLHSSAWPCRPSTRTRRQAFGCQMLHLGSDVRTNRQRSRSATALYLRWHDLGRQRLLPVCPAGLHKSLSASRRQPRSGAKDCRSARSWP